ncbi:MAG: NAD(P)-binding domain-containing protein [Betaproteobacteria bacterium]|jgi:3-hydroxyisobutyrate dehydrogenase-like beta-hydroxyacid dehydrogenase|nr:NAD(P)-binding domain-containing protein [Betaproteobacteria bacterium]
MSSTTCRLGLLGFGEAAARLARDFAQAGFTGIVAYSRSGAKAGPGDLPYERAQAAGVTLVKTVATLAKKSDIIIALTPGKAALAALKKIHKHLRPDHLYVDASSNSAAAMEKAAALVGDSAKFVDASIMGPVDLMGLKVPFVASGAHAAEFRDLMTQHGMVINVVGRNPGDASAMKLIRSVLMKGLAAVLLDTMEAARRRNILDEVIEDCSVTFNDIPFQKIIRRYVGGTAVHCERRIHEMKECLELLHSMRSTDRTTRTTIAMLRDMVKMDMPEKFPVEPDSIHPVIDAIIAARSAG